MLPFVVAALAVAILLPSSAGPASAASSTWSSLCSTRIRTSPSTTAHVKATIAKGTRVTATASVSGGSWSSDCPSNIKGSYWLKIVAVGGKSTSSLYGVSAVYAARGLFKLVTTTTSTSTNVISNCGVRLRTSASTTSKTMKIIDANTTVTAATRVSGGSWAADCKASVSGSSWYKITAVGGKSVSSLYGVSAVYAATGLFRAASTTYYGIDVSVWQGAIDWAKVKASGRSFVFAKATEGIGYEDARYDANRAGAIAEGMKFGAYHFARPGSNNPVTEADWFVNTARYQHGMLVPVLDLELTGGLGPSALITWAKAWVQRVYARLGVKPMIYATPSFWRNAMGDSRWFADNGYRLWVAHWGVTSPSVPGSNWGGRSWTAWQYTNQGTVPGISGRVDLNRLRISSFSGLTY